jgi:hypothetical protein
MRKLLVSVTMMTLMAVSFSRLYRADDNSNNGQGKLGGTVRALITGYQEVPAVSSNGVGQFDAQLSDDKTKINFKLQWKNLEGASITNADLRFGQFSVTGGVVALLCGTGAPIATCGDPASGSIEGSILATDIKGPLAQGIDPAETTVLDEVLKAMISGNTYVNIHTDAFPDGEIRGQALFRRIGLFRN